MLMDKMKNPVLRTHWMPLCSIRQKLNVLVSATQWLSEGDVAPQGHFSIPSCLGQWGLLLLPRGRTQRWQRLHLSEENRPCSSQLHKVPTAQGVRSPRSPSLSHSHSLLSDSQTWCFVKESRRLEWKPGNLSGLSYLWWITLARPAFGG